MSRLVHVLRRLWLGLGAPTDDASVDAAADERRRWPRIALRCQVTLRFSTTEAAAASDTIDVSAGGLFVRVEPPRPLGTPVRVVLEIADRTIIAGGMVANGGRRDGAWGVGVAFTEIAEDDRAWLEAMVKRRTRAGHDDR